MKFYSENSLQDFEFHDARMELDEFADGKLTVAVEHLNIHKSSPQNDFETDMEIAHAKITFADFSAKSFRTGGETIEDENGNTFSSVPVIEFKEKEAEARLISELQRGITVFELVALNGGCYIDGIGMTPFFITEFSFSSATVEWDEFAGSAWYEK